MMIECIIQKMRDESERNRVSAFGCFDKESEIWHEAQREAYDKVLKLFAQKEDDGK